MGDSGAQSTLVTLQSIGHAWPFEPIGLIGFMQSAVARPDEPIEPIEFQPVRAE